MLRADVTYDLSYATVTLKTSDGEEFRASQGLCAGSCTTLRTMFEVATGQRVFTIPAEVSATAMQALLGWLHGPREDIQMKLDREEAVPIMHAADFLGMQCWLDNCACQMNLKEGKSKEGWLAWVELADSFKSADLLLGILQAVPVNSDISAPDICSSLHSITLMKTALEYFDEVSLVHFMHSPVLLQC